VKCHRADPARFARAALAASLIAAAPFAPAATRPADATGARAAEEVPAGMRGLMAGLEAAGPRTENGAGERAAFEIAEAALRAAGIKTETSGFSDAKEGYSYSRILEASIPGRIADELAVIVPMGSWIDAGEGAAGAYGIALALDAATRSAASAAVEKPPISLRFVFLGAERRGREASGESASLGSRTWISRSHGSAALAALYLSMDAEPGRLTMRNAGKGALSPYWYYNAARRALASSGASFDMEANLMQITRLGLADRYGPAAAYLEAGIPAIELLGEGGGTGPGIGDEWLSSFIREFSKLEAGGFTDSWDRHYFIFQAGKLAAVVRETPYAVFLVIFCAIVAVSILAVTVTRRDAAKVLLRRTPIVAGQLVVLYAALVAAFLAGAGCSRIVAELLGSADAWRLAPRWAGAARMASSFFLFLSLLSILVEQRLLTPNPYFYEFAAMVVLALDILVFSAVDLSVSFYFVWAFVIVEISLAARRRWATLAAYLLMYAPITLLLIELIGRPEMAAMEKIVVPDLGGVLLLSALLLPFFVFTASPLMFFAKPGATARRRAAVAFACLAAIAEASSAVAAAAAPILKGGLRADISASERIDQDSGSFEATLKGKRRLGSGLVYRGGAPVAYRTERDELKIVGEDSRERITLVGERSVFLERERQRLVVGFADPPYEVKLKLASKGLFIYDCSLPYDISLDGKSAAIYAGVNPGGELAFTLTAPEGFEARLSVEARYLRPLEPYSLPTGEAPAEFETTVAAAFDLSGWNQ
jgi:hypothetical protein